MRPTCRSHGGGAKAHLTRVWNKELMSATPASPCTRPGDATMIILEMARGRRSKTQKPVYGSRGDGSAMSLFQHHVLGCATRAATPLARQLLAAGPRAEAAGGRIFGVFTAQIGLSANNLVMLSCFPDEAAARSVDLLAGIAAGVERHEFWEPAPRPAESETFPERDGFFSHRWFDCAEAEWPMFRQLSVDAWDNFEDVHDTRVIGFWRSRTPPGPGLVRVWLMAWYKTLGAWEGSRWYLREDHPEAKAAYDRFRARSALTLNTAVSILRRVV